MFQLRDYEQYNPSSSPSSGSLTNKTIPPSMMTSTPKASTMPACGYGFSRSPQGVCMSSGCYDGKSQCIVIDEYGKTCPYDQMLAYQSQTGQRACGPAAPSSFTPPAPPPPPAPDVSPPIPGSSSVGPGTKVVVGPAPNALYPSSFRVPTWVWVVGGLSALGIVIALFARR